MTTSGDITYPPLPSMFGRLPSSGLVVLLGAPGSGKSTFASLAFAPGDVVSSDDLRALVGGAADNLSAANQAMDLLVDIVERRLRDGLRTVVDSTGTHPNLVERLHIIADVINARVHHIHLDEPLDRCLERNRARAVGRVPDAAVEALWAKVEDVTTDVRDAGRSVATARSHLTRDLSGLRAFLAMPITEFISDDGFRIDKRSSWELVHAALGMAGLEVSSAAANENYGQISLEPKAYTAYDIEGILGADCLLVGTTTTMSPDIYLEIGTALGAGKPIGLVHPQRGGMTGMMRGLVELGTVRRWNITRDDQLAGALASAAMQLLEATNGGSAWT